MLCKYTTMNNEDWNVNKETTTGTTDSASVPMRATAYAGETGAVRAYMAIQDVLREDERVDISVYRLMLPLGDDVRHCVAVVGDVTTLAPVAFVAVLAALGDGAPLVLPESVKAYLTERAGHAARMAPYVEAHHEGGRVVRLGEDVAPDGGR